jgi:protein-disulfide isomerase
MNEGVKKFLKVGGIVVCFLAVIGLFVFLGTREDKYAGINTNEIQTASDLNGEIDEHILGDIDSGVILIEYGDFQCQGCASADPRIQALVKEYGDRIGYVFRNFPLTNIHPNTKAASSAAEAAGLQGKYWEMHISIYAHQEEWFYSSVTKRTEQFQGYARDLGLDMAQFDTDYVSNNVTKKVNFDLKLGQKDEVSGTPFFILNGRALDSKEWGTDAALREVLDKEIAKAGEENEYRKNFERRSQWIYWAGDFD